MAKPKIYTKSGDLGQTSLVSGARVAKTHPRLQAYGTIDELNSAIGVVVSELSNEPSEELSLLNRKLLEIQHSLFSMGSQLSCDDSDLAEKLPTLDSSQTQDLEKDIDRMDAALPPLKNFILPGGSRAAAHLHVARTICRRCERELIALNETVNVSSAHLVYLNRLSDYLFTASRYCNHVLNQPETLWKN